MSEMSVPPENSGTGNAEDISIFTRIRDTLEDLESDYHTMDTSDFHHFKDRYNENLDQLKELVEMLPRG